MADFYGAQNGGSFWPDAQSDQSAQPMAPAQNQIAGNYVPPMGYPSAMPIVQPLIIVPYSGQSGQGGTLSPNGFPGLPGMPGMMETDDYSYTDDAPARAREKGKANVAAILAFLLGLITVAVYVIGFFVDSLAILNVLKGNADIAVYEEQLGAKIADASGLAVIIDFVKNISGYFGLKDTGKEGLFVMLFAIGLAVNLVFTAVAMLINLFSVKARKYPIINKIFALLALVGIAVAIVPTFLTGDGLKMELNIGAYILAGLTVVTTLIALLGKRKSK